MSLRRFLVAACALFLFEGQASAQEEWTSYKNARFGTSIQYQEFFEPDPPPANGDGQSFTGPEGANFRVYARHNVDDETPASYLAELLAESSYSEPTYTRVRNDRLTVSGVRGVRGHLIYYEAYIFSRRGVIHAFEIEYPARFKASYDPTIERMARSFKGP